MTSIALCNVGSGPCSSKSGPSMSYKTNVHVRAGSKVSSRASNFRLSCRATSASVSQSSVDRAIETLKTAGETFAVKPVEVFDALRTLEKAKLDASEWPEIVGGKASPGKRWRLVFTTGTKAVREALQGKGKGGGQYFPLTAAQRWDASKGEIENGIFLGLLGALTFSGPYAISKKKLSFDFDTLCLKLGPLKFKFAIKEKIEDYTPSPKDPFFILFYVDDDIIAARGRGGGIAFWKKTDSDFEMKHLVS